MRQNRLNGIGKEDHRALVLWAVECAEHVLHLFERSLPEDDRPRRALDAGRDWALGGSSVVAAREAAFAAHSAAREAADLAAQFAARAAGHAAAAAHVAGHARHAAGYAVRSVMAATGPVGADEAADAERLWQDGRLPDDLKDVVMG